MSAPDIVYIDTRVARQMDQDGGGDLIGYVREDVHADAVKKAGARGQETVVQIITNPEGRLVGLSSWGRVWAFVAEDKDKTPEWIPVTDFLPQPELDS